jgi:hypothetical protein
MTRPLRAEVTGTTGNYKTMPERSRLSDPAQRGDPQGGQTRKKPTALRGVSRGQEPAKAVITSRAVTVHACLVTWIMVYIYDIVSCSLIYLSLSIKQWL